MTPGRNEEKESPISRRKKALADAIAGVCASLIALWTFYPIDVWITNIQAEQVQQKVDAKSPYAERKPEAHHRRIPTSQNNMFAGVVMKTAHTTASSFFYFYIYSFLFSLYRNKRQLSNTTDISTSIRLLLTAVAAMANTFVTLPLDVLSAQQQTHKCSSTKSDDKNSEVSIDFCSPLPSGENSIMSNRSYFLQCDNLGRQEKNDLECDIIKESKVFEAIPLQAKSVKDRKDDDMSLQSFSSSTSLSDVVEKNYGKEQGLSSCEQRKERSPNRLQALLSLWKGLIPSLILCTNPAIHYTAFESFKAKWKTIRNAKSDLNMLEVFVVGFMAKFIATILTYPIVRAKVMLMVSNKAKFHHDQTSNLHSKGDKNKTNYGTLRNPSSSLTQILSQEYQSGGIVNGLYRGCSVQLLHTLLKSALVMMLREKITRFSYQALFFKTSSPSSKTIQSHSSSPMK
jgi:Mitochondrial carrier protein